MVSTAHSAAVGAQETDLPSRYAAAGQGLELVRVEPLGAPVPVAPELLRGQGGVQVHLVRLLDPGDAQRRDVVCKRVANALSRSLA